MVLASSPPSPFPLLSPAAGRTLASTLAEVAPATSDSHAALGPSACVCDKAVSPELELDGVGALSCGLEEWAAGNGDWSGGEASSTRDSIIGLGAAAAALAAVGVRAAPGARAGPGAGAVVTADAGAGGKAAYMGNGIPYGSNDVGTASGPVRGAAP